MTEELAGFNHRFELGTSDVPPVLLLHGTGGDESDLIPLGRAVAPGAALLSPRGPVLERGMPRFFRRLAEGVFDEADVVRRAGELARFVKAAQQTYDLATPIALGFSNGANIAAATLLLHPDTFAGAVLLRPMMPLADTTQVDLNGMPILMLSGATDPIAPVLGAQALASRFVGAGGNVQHSIVPGGHGLTRDDMEAVRAWFAERSVRHQADRPITAAD